MNFSRLFTIITACIFISISAFASSDISIKIENEPMSICPDLYGIFFEDINYAADGGLYPEQIQNRSFEYSRGDNRDWNSLSFWQTLQSTPNTVSLSAKTDNPLNANNPHYALLTVKTPGSRNGISNSGFDGIVLKKGDRYDVSFFARKVSGSPNPIIIQVEDSQGKPLTKLTFNNISTQWTKYTATFKSPSYQTHASLNVLMIGTGQIALDMISLFPQNTFKDRPNGLHRELAQTIADLQPKFIRFPGGCLAHGDGLDNMYRWKETIGPLEQRKAQRNIWRYHQTLGLGYFEYFQYCEDIGAEPLPVVPAGVCCQNSGNYLNLVPKGQQGIPMDEMPEYVQEVLDLVEWANGPADSEWGSKRAAAGHPEPFNLKYLGVGNEDQITEVFKVRYKMIEDAIHAQYPGIIVIGTTGPATDGYDYDEGWKFAIENNIQMVDEHGYKSPSWFWQNINRFDEYKRTGTKVYLGEYAAHESNRANTLRSALAEAAYMTSLERNGDLVYLSSYAPLLSKRGHTQWTPDMIYFDNTTITPSINYYAQQLFSVNSGDAYLPTKIKINTQDAPESDTTNTGILLGTWNTNVKYDDVKVIYENKTILNESFDTYASGWKTFAGNWSLSDGSYTQTGSDSPALSMYPFTVKKSDYTITLKAMKISGAEGFLIGFGAIDENNYYWLNLGGWNNTAHRIQKTNEGSTSSVGPEVKGSIADHRWYNIKIEVVNNIVKCYLDGSLIIEMPQAGFTKTPDITASTVTDSNTGDIIIKIVSKSDRPLESEINLSSIGNIDSFADVTVLTGDKLAVNQFAQAPQVLPYTTKIKVSKNFKYTVQPHSLTVLRIKTK